MIPSYTLVICPPKTPSGSDNCMCIGMHIIYIISIANFSSCGTARVVFSMRCRPRCQTISSSLMTNNRISIGKIVPWVFFTFSSLIQIYQLILAHKKFRHIIATKSSIIYCWVFGQWLNIPLASTCLLTHSPIWTTQWWIYIGVLGTRAPRWAKVSLFSCSFRGKLVK